MEKGRFGFKQGAVVCAVVVLVAVSAVVAKVQVSGDSGAPQQGAGRGRGGGSVVSVKTQVLSVQTLHGYVSTNGEIESQNSVSVFPDVSGKVISMSVMLGSKVSRGEILGYVDPSAPGSYFKQSPVYAPISGSVISTPVKNGTTVSTNSVITQIGDISNLQIRANVPERYVSVLRTGLKADISLEAYPGVVFPATVTRVSPVVDSTSRTKEIILHFDSKDERINAGMFAKVVLFTEDYEGLVTMPSDSLVQNGEKFYAYTVNADSTVTKREVTLGQKVDGIVQISSGLKAGERVVVQGQTTLADGSRIQDITEGSGQSRPSNSEKNSVSDRRQNSERGERGEGFSGSGPDGSSGEGVNPRERSRAGR